ncbi:MAG TPA: HAMP domain-containing sensor histidine kinase [Rhodanobacteraceae bacterium]|nr:HAMP domain-containing sensor histidine kinase [Rhodanobacteraceae bacterium]
MAVTTQVMQQPKTPGVDHIRRELRVLDVYRAFQALVYLALSLGSLAFVWMPLRDPVTARATALIYLSFALLVLARDLRGARALVSSTSAFLTADVVAAFLMTITVPAAHTGIAAMLMINVGAAALLLSPRLGGLFAALATLAMIAQALLVSGGGDIGPSLVEAGLFGVFYFAIAAFCFAMGSQMRASEALAEQRGTDLANLAQVNDLIIRRMKTGVLLVDEGNHILQINESAWMLVGNPGIEQRDLGIVAPELSRRLYHWRTTHEHDANAVALAEGSPEIIPRFTRLSAHDDSYVLIFLDDTSLVSQRAEQLTLTTLGRLSASIAHEIRNPLAAIRYSAQLLAESDAITDSDQRMVEIINNHCGRVNEIIENILQLSRRERSRPESLDLNNWAVRFVDEYKEANDIGRDSLRPLLYPRPVEALADPQHLQQVMWNLVQNALRYGRLPDEPARVMVVARLASDTGPPLLEVIDRGPGIPPKVAAQIFEPFFTTHQYGTGLGLYLAKQMCEANQASLEYVPVAGGGSCFRITLTAPVRAPMGMEA